MREVGEAIRSDLDDPTAERLERRPGLVGLAPRFAPLRRDTEAAGAEEREGVLDDDAERRDGLRRRRVEPAAQRRVARRRLSALCAHLDVREAETPGGLAGQADLLRDGIEEKDAAVRPERRDRNPRKATARANVDDRRARRDERGKILALYQYF